MALVLRDALETPGATRRAGHARPRRWPAGSAAELRRYGVVADDSAGEPLAETPPAVFLRLLARAVAEELAPVPLLAVLKHPLAAVGLAPAACRPAARTWSWPACAARGPEPGLAGLRRALDKAAPARRGARALLARMEARAGAGACASPPRSPCPPPRGLDGADRRRRAPRRHR